MTSNGRTIKALAQPTKPAFLFVLESRNRPADLAHRRTARATVERARREDQPDAAVSDQACAIRPAGRVDRRPDRLHAGAAAEALEIVKRYRIGPLYTPPALATPDGPLATLMLPADVGGANWPGGSFDPETNRLYIHSHTTVFAVPNTAIGVWHCPGLRTRRGLAALSRRSGRRAEPAGARRVHARRGGGTSVQGLPLIKPPYDRITAYDMNTGSMLWQKTHSSTPDDIKNHPALKGLTCRVSGQPGRTFIGVLTTKTLVIAGEGGVHTNEAGQRVALLRAYDKATGADVGEVNMPAKQTGSPMTYMHNGKQYIAVTITGTGANTGGEILAYALP